MGSVLFLRSGFLLKQFTDHLIAHEAGFCDITLCTHTLWLQLPIHPSIHPSIHPPESINQSIHRSTRNSYSQVCEISLCITRHSSGGSIIRPSITQPTEPTSVDSPIPFASAGVAQRQGAWLVSRRTWVLSASALFSLLFKNCGLWTLSCDFALADNETFKWLALPPTLMQNHSGGDSVTS